MGSDHYFPSFSRIYSILSHRKRQKDKQVTLEKIFSILILFIISGQPGDNSLQEGRPTSKGIARYVEEQGELVISEFQDFVHDTVYNVAFFTEEAADFGDPNQIELGHYFPYDIFITEAELFEAYEVGNLTPRERKNLRESNKFVKATMVHELTHAYVNQIGVEMRSLGHHTVHEAYQIDIWIVRSSETFGSVFMEEGLCEYITGEMGELIPPEKPFIPKTIQELTLKENQYGVNYKYSTTYLKPFLDTIGFKRGVKTILHNPPPTFEEILHPELFFGRLELVRD